MSLLSEGGAPYLQRIRLLSERVADFNLYPFVLPVIRTLDVKFQQPITFFVGENGTGKSTIIEAIAGLLRLPISGGGVADRGLRHGPIDDHDLARAIRPSFRKQPRDAFFFRGELSSHFAKLLDDRNSDPSFTMSGDPYASYGGKSLSSQSHGESFLSVMQNRIRHGLYLLDEPEAALSPQKQLILMALIADRAAHGAQFVIATHSPLLMTIPQADIMALDNNEVSRVKLEETEHFRITKDVLQNPAGFWKHMHP